MQNKTLIIALSVLVVLICGIGFATAYSDNPWEWLGREQTRIDATKEADETVARINGEVVTKGELMFWQRMVEFGNRVSGADEPTDAKTVFYKHLLPSKVVASAAKSQNLWPTERETKDYITEVRQAFESLDEAREELKNYLAGLGLSEDEYFEEYAFENYRQGLAYGNYRQKIAQQFKGKEPQEITTQVEAHIAELIEQAQVKTVDPLLQ